MFDSMSSGFFTFENGLFANKIKCFANEFVMPGPKFILQNITLQKSSLEITP